jgi:hypothetical protein
MVEALTAERIVVGFNRDASEGQNRGISKLLISNTKMRQLVLVEKFNKTGTLPPNLQRTFCLKTFYRHLRREHGLKAKPRESRCCHRLDRGVARCERRTRDIRRAVDWLTPANMTAGKRYKRNGQ